MTIKERINEFIEYKNINVNEFERSINVSKSYWRNTKNISSEVLSTIGLVYSDLNVSWALTGQGEMLNTNVVSEETEEYQSLNKQKMTNNNQTETINVNELIQAMRDFAESNKINARANENISLVQLENVQNNKTTTELMKEMIEFMREIRNENSIKKGEKYQDEQEQDDAVRSVS